MQRILFATILGLSGFVAYVAGVVTLADRLSGTPWPVHLLYFILAGVVWVIPARWLILWSVRHEP